MGTASRYVVCLAVAWLTATSVFPITATLPSYLAAASARGVESLLRTFIDVPSFQIQPGSVALYAGPDYSPPSCQILAPVQTRSFDTDSPDNLRSDLIHKAQAHVLTLGGNALVVDFTTYTCGDTRSSISIEGRALRCPATSLVSCVDSICRAETALVCGLFTDGTQRTYR